MINQVQVYYQGWGEYWPSYLLLLNLAKAFSYTERNMAATPLEEAQPWRLFCACSEGINAYV